MADNQITPFQLTDQFTMDNFNQRINETNTALQKKADTSVIDQIENDVNVLDSRMNEFTSLPQGSTSGDAELADIRVGANGNTYPNAGDAVRAQYSELKQDIDNKAQKVVYQPNATYTDKNGNKIRDFYLGSVLDLEMNGADADEKYSFGAFRRKSTFIDITIWDSAYKIVCEYNVEETGANGKKLIEFAEKNSSGVTAKAIIDFDVFIVGTDYESLIYRYCGIDTHCYTKTIRESEIKLDTFKKKGVFDDSATLIDKNKNDISSFLTSVIKDIYIMGASNTETYAIGQISRNASNVVQINIWNSAYTVVLAIYIADASSYSGIKTLDLSALNSSGMGGKITVDFDVLKVGVYYDAIPIKSTPIAKEYIFGTLREQTFVNSNNPRRWEGKKWYAIGDSFTEQNIYPYYLNEYCKFLEYHNAGWSGHCMKDMVTKITETSTSGYDIITVLCGTNDYGAGTILGSVSDSKNADTFYGHVKKLIETILGQNPEARLCFFTPTIRGEFENQPVYPNKNSVGFGLGDYADAIIEVCKIYAIPCCDTFRTSQFNELTLTTLTQDNLHPNYVGGKLLARQMQGFIEAL